MPMMGPGIRLSKIVLLISRLTEFVFKFVISEQTGEAEGMYWKKNGSTERKFTTYVPPWNYLKRYCEGKLLEVGLNEYTTHQGNKH